MVFGGVVQAMFSLKLEFERGNAETEASETDHREGPTIDPEADIRAGPIGTGDLGTAADQQDLGFTCCGRVKRA